MSDRASTGPPGRPSLATLEGGRRARRLAWLYTAAAVALLPWIVYLAATLPRRNLDLHYRAAWVGFDLLLGFAIVRTAYMAFRLDQRVQFSATATATLLIVDAWFDVTTSGSRTQIFVALVLAAFIEIPAAIFSLYLAHQVNRRIWDLAVAAGPDGVGDRDGDSRGGGGGGGGTVDNGPLAKGDPPASERPGK
ncbi:MAG: hypothetical protein ACRDYE_14395 [Acidimicrobiales bacterium]